MNTRTLDRHLRAATTPPVTPPPIWYDRPERIALRTDLYLIAHDDDTGHPHLDKQAIATGLAGAVLLELWHAGRVHLERQDTRHTTRHGTRRGRHNHEQNHGRNHEQHGGQSHVQNGGRHHGRNDGQSHGRHGGQSHGRNHRQHGGQVTLLDVSATGDVINDAALSLLWRMGGTVDIRRFIQEFATISLYEQVRDHLVATGVLRAVTKRRWGLFRREIRRPANTTHPVRARMRIRDVARLYKPGVHDLNLAALVTTLGLTPHIHLTDHSVSGVYLRLAELVAPDHPIHDITNAIRPHRARHR